MLRPRAHLRYCEALARFGDAEGFFRALCQLNPIAIRELVPSATSRRSNCHYSGSDASFADRYQAFAEYDRVQRGELATDSPSRSAERPLRPDRMNCSGGL